ncbi:MAG TPA: low affinity iron permease family protein [Rhodanobacteraceae bacterium]|nr:low affinity iron permease family protein [Rhodanobacteraceae bacterium]
MKRISGFSLFARWTSGATGHPVAFALAVLVVVVWAGTGRLFHYSDTWQLVINTGTTIVTFLMVFLIQSTQNRDSKALHAKLDELIKTSRNADNALLGADELDDESLQRLCKHYTALAEQRRARTAGHRGARTGGGTDER